MINFFMLCLLASPVILVMGLMKPSLFTKIFGKVPTRLAVTTLAGAIFLGSFIGVEATAPPTETVQKTVTPIEAPEVLQIKAETPIIKTEPVFTPEPEPTPIVETSPEPIFIPEPTPAPSTPNINCSSNSYNCSDFSSWTEANAVYNYCLSIGAGDIHDLDRDNDGACDSLR